MARKLELHDIVITKLLDGSFFRYINKRVENGVQKFSPQIAEAEVLKIVPVIINKKLEFAFSQINNHIDKKLQKVTDDSLKPALQRKSVEFPSIDDLNAGLKSFMNDAAKKIKQSSETKINKKFAEIEPN